MKILYSCLSRSWGGLEMRTIQGAEQLFRRNIETEILSYPGSEISIEAKAAGITNHNLKAAGYLNPLQILRLSSIIKKNKYDLIHTQASKDLWVIVPALNISGSRIPLVLTKRVGSSVIKKDFLHRKLYSRVSTVVAISNEIKKNVLETCPVPGEKVQLIFNGVDLGRFDPSSADGLKVRNEFSIKPDELLIGMAGRFTSGKGHEEFLAAAGKLLTQFPRLKFLIAGEASRGEDIYFNKIKDLADKYGISEKVIFTGFRRDIPDVLAALDIFVFPSHLEAFGNALIEAMAMGKPSVSAASAGVLDIVIGGETGLLFEKKNADDLTENISILIKSPEKRILFGNNAREHVKRNFDLNSVTDRLINLYNSLLS